jgi:hypothetical protein
MDNGIPLIISNGEHASAILLGRAQELEIRARDTRYLAMMFRLAFDGLNMPC